MSIRHGLLAILADRPAHGYGLKSSFEDNTAGAWPLNVGQVYTTLGRLQRDGLVEPAGHEEGRRQAWQITDGGREALAGWYASAVDDQPSRDELTIKVLLAVADPATDARQVLQRQRVATMQRLQGYTRHKRDADPETELPWVLLLDALILQADAEERWLDLCDQRLDQLQGEPS
ncbi:MAG: PadR family transcriptional regulator [Acidobacteriota bacterium]